MKQTMIIFVALALVTVAWGVQSSPRIGGGYGDTVEEDCVPYEVYGGPELWQANIACGLTGHSGWGTVRLMGDADHCPTCFGIVSAGVLSQARLVFQTIAPEPDAYLLYGIQGVVTRIELDTD